MRRVFRPALALLLILSLTACSGGSATAAAMHLRRTEGTVSVSNGDGKDVPPLDHLSLYSGYRVNTRSASYAWIDLDDVKLAKLDQNSEIAIQKEGKALDIEVRSGSLFFNVTQPLEDDETMNIRTSTMLVGIRGTSGWVEANGGLSQVYILEGKVECSAGGRTVRVNAGEFAELTADGELTVEEFANEDLPAFVREEVGGGAGETPGPDASETPEPVSTPEPTPEPTQEPQEVTWTLNNGTLTISGTGPMEDHPIPPWYGDRDSITAVVIENGVTSIAASAFMNLSNLTGVTIPASVTSMGDSAFAYCRSLTGVTLPDGVTAIPYRAFFECGGLKSIAIPGSVTSIGADAFRNCRSLTGMTMPASVASIGSTAFYGCRGLADVYYGGSESQWGQIDIESNNDPLLSAAIHYGSTGPGPQEEIAATGETGDLTWEFRGSTLTISGTGSMPDYNLDSIPWIDYRDQLQTLIIGDGVTRIGTQAFWQYGNLTSVVIGNSVTSIGSCTFLGCSSLTGVSIPNSVTNIENSAFKGCSSLAAVTMPDSVASIGAWAFDDCAKLTDVYYGGSADQWGRISINKTGNGTLLGANIHYNSSGPDVTDTPTADALKQYRIIVGQANMYDYGEARDEIVSYQYALVRMQPGDVVPTLLLERQTEGFYDGSRGNVRIFQYDPETGNVHQPADVLMEGTAAVGGYRGSLAMMGDGNGIQVMEWASGTGDADIFRVTLEGDTLLWTAVWEGRIDLVPDDMTAIGIEWHDISDTGALNS